MNSAAKVYRQHPDPDTKLGDLKTMDLDSLVVIQNRYKKLLKNRALLSRLRDGGESAWRALAAAEAELAARGQDAMPELESRRAAAEVDRLAQKMASMEWETPARRRGPAEPLDSDDDSDEMEGSDQPASRCVDSSHTASAAAPHGASRLLLPKSATSRREARFSTNRPRCGGGRAPGGGGGGGGVGGGGIAAQWADSALAAPARPDARTRLLAMDESLQLLAENSRQTQAERSAAMAQRFAQYDQAEMEGMEESDADEPDMAHFSGAGEGS